MLKLKKLSKGRYVTTDGKYYIEKDFDFWYGIDAKTNKSVVDSERTLREIKEKLEGKYNK